MILRIHGAPHERIEVEWNGRFLSDGDVIILKASRGAFEAGVWTVKSVHHEVDEDDMSIREVATGFERPLVGEQIVTVVRVRAA